MVITEFILKADLHLPGEDATTCPAALSARLTMQKNSLRNKAINSFFCYARRTLRTTGQAVQLINPGLAVSKASVMAVAKLITGSPFLGPSVSASGTGQDGRAGRGV